MENTIQRGTNNSDKRAKEQQKDDNVSVFSTTRKHLVVILEHN